MEQNPANQANNNNNSSNNANSNNSVNSNSNPNNNNSNNNNKNNRCNLIVNYLPQSIKEQDFNQLFGKIGPVKACKLMFDRQTGYSFGYGFVEYINEDDARKAIEAFNGYQIQHKRLKVAYARPNCEDTKNTNLYIRNIPISYDEQQIEDLFSLHGEVIQVRLLRDQNTAFSRRIGFVIMATKQMAQNAIKNLDNTVPPNGGTEPIYVKYADEEGKKRHGPGGGNSFGNMNHGMNTNQRNQNHHHHHHQNPYQNTSNYLNQHNAAHGFNFGNPNSFMMAATVTSGAGANQNVLNNLSANSLQNLGKMKSNRTSGHQNRYNPIGGGNGGLNNPVGMNNTGMSQANNGAGGANGYNPWNMAAAAAAAAALQQPYSNYGAPNTLIGNSGFDNLINTIGSGGASSGNANNSSYGSHHPNMHHHQGHHMQQQHLHNSSNSSNYLNNASAAAMATAVSAVGGIGNSPSTSNLLDANAGGTGSVNMDTKSGASAGSNIIYVYGIGSQATESDLFSLFSNCGRIIRVNVIKNPKTGQCKGYGFVIFESFEEAYFAVHNMNGYMYHNRPLQVSFKSLKSSNSLIINSTNNRTNKKANLSNINSTAIF